MAVSPDDILKRVPPQNLEAEQSVLGAVLLDNESIGNAFEVGLTVDSFYRESHRQIIKAMVDLDEARIPIDAITLTQALRERGLLEQIGGPAYIAELAAFVPTASNIRHYARIVLNTSRLRAAGSVFTDLASSSYEAGVLLDVDEYFDRAHSAILDIVDPHVNRVKRFHNSAQLAREVLKMMETLYENRGKGLETTYGFPTGYIDLDRQTGGLQPGEMLILAARPSMGKTALALNMLTNIAFTGTPVAFFSLEQTAREVMLRMLCGEARIDSARVKAGFIGERDFPKLAQAAARISEAPIYINDDSALSILEIKLMARNLYRRVPNLSCVAIDYAGLARPASRGLTAQDEKGMAEISAGTKALAKELFIPVILLAQLNRKVEDRTDHRPKLSDLRSSGALEQDADGVWFIHRPGYYQPAGDDGTSEVIIAKQRNGVAGETVRMTFIKQYTKFENYAPEQGVFEDAQ